MTKENDKVAAAAASNPADKAAGVENKYLKGSKSRVMVFSPAHDFARQADMRGLDGNFDHINDGFNETAKFLHKADLAKQDAARESAVGRFNPGTYAGMALALAETAIAAANSLYKVFRQRGDDHDVAAGKVADALQRAQEARTELAGEKGDYPLDENGAIVKPDGYKPADLSDLF